MAKLSAPYEIYVLKLAENKYYIGKTTNFSKRISAHRSGIFTTAWTKKYPYISTLERMDDNGYSELATTLWYMEHYGIENVRGADYCNITLTKEQKAEISRHINAENGRCYFCGSDEHYCGECKTKPSFLRRLASFLCGKRRIANEMYIELENSGNIIEFGKYKNKTYEQVLREDPSYCRWILLEKPNTNSFQKFQDWLRKNMVE